MPIITFRWPSIKAWIAASPSRLASMRSLALGAPPRCRWPRIETLTSYPGYSFFTRRRNTWHLHSCFQTFGHNYDAAVFRLSESAPDECFQLVHVRPVFRNDGRFSTGSYCAVLCQEARITPHHFDKEDTVMGGCRVPDFIHAFHNGVQCRIISYGKIGTI